MHVFSYGPSMSEITGVSSLQLMFEQSEGIVWDSAAGPEESSKGEVPRLQKFCRRHY